MRLRLPVNKLENATAEYVSLVRRGANRQPFRIVKRHPDEENSMIDIDGKLNLADLQSVLKGDGDKKQAQSKGRYVTRRKGDPEPAKLVGFVIEKADLLDAGEIEELGRYIKVDKTVANDDGTLLFKQVDEPPEEVTVVRLSEHALGLFDELDPEPVIKGTPFEATFKSCGFLLSPGEALANTMATCRKALDEAKPDALETVKKSNHDALEEVNAYSSALNDLVPVTVWKAEAVVAKACLKRKTAAQATLDAAKKADEDKQEAARKAAAEQVDCPVCSGKGCNVCATGKVTKAEAETIAKAFPFKKKPVAAAGGEAEGGGEAGGDNSGEEGGECPAGVDPKAWAMMTPQEKAAVKETAQKAEKARQEGAAAATVPAMDEKLLQKALATALAPFTQSLSELTTAVGEVKKAQEAQATELAGVKDTVAKADLALKGKLIGGHPANDNEDRSNVHKGDDEPEPLGNIDTAYMDVRRVQKSALAHRAVTASRVR